MLLRASTFIAGVMEQGHAAPRSAMGASNTIQVVTAGGMSWAKKRVFFRNSPYTIDTPHLGQAEVRVQFGRIAKEAAGCRGLVDGLPCVAAAIRNRLTGFTAEHRIPETAYPSKVKRTVHTMEELEAMLRRRLAGAPRAVGGYYSVPPALG